MNRVIAPRKITMAVKCTSGACSHGGARDRRSRRSLYRFGPDTASRRSPKRLAPATSKRPGYASRPDASRRAWLAPAPSNHTRSAASRSVVGSGGSTISSDRDRPAGTSMAPAATRRPRRKGSAFGARSSVHASRTGASACTCTTSAETRAPGGTKTCRTLPADPSAPTVTTGPGLGRVVCCARNPHQPKLAATTTAMTMVRRDMMGTRAVTSAYSTIRSFRPSGRPCDRPP